MWCEVRKSRSPGPTTVARREMTPPANVASGSCQQARRAPTLDRRPVAQHLERQSLAKVEPSAREEPSGNRPSADRSDEVTARDAVAVDEDEVAAASPGRAEVPHACETESFVRLPGMDEAIPEHRSPARDGLLGLSRRAVVRDHHLERGIGLARQAPEHGVEGLRPLVRRDDHADGRGRTRPSRWNRRLDLRRPTVTSCWQPVRRSTRAVGARRRATGR